MSKRKKEEQDLTTSVLKEEKRKILWSRRRLIDPSPRPSPQGRGGLEDLPVWPIMRVMGEEGGQSSAMSDQEEEDIGARLYLQGRQEGIQFQEKKEKRNIHPNLILSPQCEDRGRRDGLSRRGGALKTDSQSR